MLMKMGWRQGFSVGEQRDTFPSGMSFPSIYLLVGLSWVNLLVTLYLLLRVYDCTLAHIGEYDVLAVAFICVLWGGS